MNFSIALNYGIKVLSVILIFILGKWSAKISANLIKKTLIKANVDITLVNFLSELTYFGLIIAVILAVLGNLGINTISFITMLGVLGLTIGLALQKNISNFGAGIIILFLRPFKIGDFVEAGGASGNIDAIGIFNTTFKTGDNKIIIVPNSNIISSNIINYSKEPVRRVDLIIGVSYQDDLKIVKSTLEHILSSHPKILKEPKFSVALAELANSSINFNVRGWVNSEDYWSVRSNLLETIKTTFDEKGITIPYPQMDVHVKAA
ncbi:MAG: mechanosensitive ion channel domain-containing protein [Nautiliaceae bacterium]|jgi:small conductance mechanosensitive channel